MYQIHHFRHRFDSLTGGPDMLWLCLCLVHHVMVFEGRVMGFGYRKGRPRIEISMMVGDLDLEACLALLEFVCEMVECKTSIVDARM